MIFKPVDQQQQQQKKNWSFIIVNLELQIVVLYGWDGFGFSRSFGHMMFQECDVWVHSLFYLLLHAWIVLYICNFFSLFLIVIVIVMRFIHEPLGNPLPRYDTNKLIDWLIDCVTTNVTFSSFLVLNSCIESFHHLYCQTKSLSMHHDTTAKYPQGKLCPQIKEIL